MKHMKLHENQGPLAALSRGFSGFVILDLGFVIWDHETRETS